MGICHSNGKNLRKSYTNKETEINSLNKLSNDKIDIKKSNTFNENFKKKIYSEDLPNLSKNSKERNNEKINFKKEHCYKLMTNDFEQLDEFTINYNIIKNVPKGEFFFNKKTDNKISNNGIDNLSKKVELYITLLNVINDSLNYSIKIFICNNKKYGQYDFIKQTEEISGFTINYGTTLIFDYYFEKEQMIRCQIFEEGNKISTIDFSVSHIMGKCDFKTLKKIYTTESNNEICDIQLEIKTLKKDDKLENLISEFSDIKFQFFDNDNDERFFILKNNNDGNLWRSCYKSTEFTPKNNISTLKKIRIDSFFLCNELDQKIIMEIYKTKNLLYPNSYVQFSLNNINSPLTIYTQLNENNIKNNENNEKKGLLYIKHEFKKKNTFIDYLKKGININLNIAIDYTISNGKPTEKNSLHYDSENKNDYENAIESCGSIVGIYDKDQKFPVYGFGGIPFNENEVNHCFNINFKKSPDIESIKEVLSIYKQSLKKIQFSGPTFFSPILQKIMQEIGLKMEKNRNENYYEILMILTDGIINDMKETIELLIDCAELPISVIIIGIGKANFKDMIILDGDEFPLTDHNGRVTKRDLVQFVMYDQFKGGNQELSDEVLKEIPRQIEEYYALTGNYNERKFNL